MNLLLDIFGFLSVLLRGVVLTAQSLTLGGIVFVVLFSLPFEKQLTENGYLINRYSLALLRKCAIALAVSEAATLLLQSSVLMGSLELTWPEALDTHFAFVDFMVLLLATVVASVVSFQLPKNILSYLLPATGVLFLMVQVTSTHAVSRIDNRALLMGADFMHALGAGMWIGGLPYFLIALRQLQTGSDLLLIGRRYSLVSMTSVALIIVGGMTMAWFYIGSIDAIYGTAYGIMTSSKVVLLGFLLLLGGMNYLTVESLRRDPSTSVLRLRRFVEVEIGIGMTILFTAASLTSLPPGEDLIQDRVTLHEIVERITPQWPIRLESPDHSTLAIPELEARIAVAEASKSSVPAAYIPGEGLPAPRKAEDIAWSEYNHHWAGIFVLMIGVLAMFERMGLRLARNWPLIFLGMAGFLFVRSDPEVWPLGQVGFFDSLRDPEVVQHRVFVLLITIFGLFEWGVRTARIRSPKAALVFPLLTSLGGALLLTHSHAIANIKDQLLIEITHVPLALSSIVAGWARWLEIRLDGRLARIAGWIWPVAFILVAFILLIYREA